MADHFSSDLIWECTRFSNSFLVKRRQAGGVQFSRDPLNLTNKHSRKYDGFVNEKAFGLQPGKNGGITLMVKKADKLNKPASALQTTTFGAGTPARKVYRSVVSSTAKRGYRADLRAEAVARASAIRKSQRPVKDAPAPKLRGSKAKKAAEKSE